MQNIVKFTEFLGKLSAIKRTVKLKGTGDFENDAEHSFQVALTSWYIADALKIPVKTDLLLSYALAHDLVEVHAGDTDPFKSSKEFVASKQDREAKALLTIQNEFPNFPAIHKAVENYEKLLDEESKIVHFVDKLLPDLNILLAGDPYYRDNKVTYEAWREWLDGKLQKSTFKNEKMQNLVEEFITYVKESADFSPSV